MSGRDDRPDPDALLDRVQAEEERRSRSTLKIFFGYAPGVGKTYRMLESAQRLKSQGVDIVVGYVETHGRPETARLLEGLEILPRRKTRYRGIEVDEFDLDGALARKPAVLLLDELAHSNLDGIRHNKRWQDVMELLGTGISVHTTLNVQHLESVTDIVSRITSVHVRETVPDSIIERADEIEVVDIPPDELLVRLREGKVYVPHQARRAIRFFFRRGNLLALRELTLRRAAERLDLDVRTYRRENKIQDTWTVSERILVSVSPGPASERAIQNARRMAAGLRAPWVAVHVEVTNARPLPREERERLQSYLRLAESLGGDVVSLSGEHVGEELLRYAKEHDVTQILVGRPSWSRWQELTGRSLIQYLIRESGDIGIYAVAAANGISHPKPTASSRYATRPDWAKLRYAAAFIALATGIAAAVRTQLAEADTVMVYLFAIMVVAFRFGMLPSLLAAGLSVAAYDFFFVPPFYTFSVKQARHILTFGMMFAVGLAISSLTGRLRRRGELARTREARTAALYSLTQELEPISDENEAAQIITRHAQRLFGGEAAILLSEPIGGSQLAGQSSGARNLSNEELAVAHWTIEHGRSAGRGTDTLPGSRLTCLPLRRGESTVGAVALWSHSLEMLDAEHRGFLDAFLRQAAGAIERVRLAEEAKAAALRIRTEEMRSSLLSAVSHDLRTPLAAITGAATALRDAPSQLEETQRTQLVEMICGEAERMEHLISNVVAMDRVESGEIVPNRDWVPLEEIVGSALERTGEMASDFKIILDLPQDLPLVFADPVLLEQVLINLIENATKYASPAGPIEIKAREQGKSVEIEVADHGPGIPLGAEERVFEKHFRGRDAERRGGGLGLGLAICRGIVQAHEGTIVAQNREGGGAAFRIRLPLRELSSEPVLPAEWEEPPGEERVHDG